MPISKIEVESSKKILENLEKMKETSLIKAPISGVIEEINKESDNPLMPFIKIVNKENFLLKIGVDESVVKKFSGNKTVTVMIDDNTYKGKIVKVGEKKEKSTGQYLIDVEIPNKDLKHDLNSYARVILEENNLKEKKSLSKNAIVRENNKSFVYTVNENDIVEKKEIKIGKEENHVVEIVDGIEKDEKIVTKGKEFIKQGDKVNILEDER